MVLFGYIIITALAGLALYVIIGVIATGPSAQFYHHFELRLGKKYSSGRGIANGLAWDHLFLMNIGIAAESLMMIYMLDMQGILQFLQRKIMD